MEGFGWYTFEICKRIVEKHPEHHFFFFFDRPFDTQFVFSNNVTPIVCSPPARHPFLFYWWFEFSIAKALKKYAIDLFFSPDGYLSLKSKVPQIITIHDLNFEHYPKDLPFLASKYLRYFFPKFAHKAKHIITVSEFSKKDIIQRYKIPEEKISVIWNGSSPLFKPFSEAEKHEIRSQFEIKKPYFLFVGSLHPRKNIKNLLLAYQKYYHSCSIPFDLVIVGSFLWKSFEKELFIPKSIQNSIHLLGHLPIESLVRVTAAAEVFVYTPYFEGFGIPLAEALRCHLPIISGNLTSLPEVVDDAAVLVNPFDIDEISDAMTQMTENKGLREKYSQLSANRAHLFSWDISAEKTWEVIEKGLQ